MPQGEYRNPQAEERATAGSTLSVLSAVIYPLILSGILLFLFNTGETGVAGLVVGLLFAAGTGVAMGMGGFYLIIIPLPIVFLFKWGCSKRTQKFSRKLTLGLLSFICPALVFASAFLLR